MHIFYGGGAARASTRRVVHDRRGAGPTGTGTRQPSHTRDTIGTQRQRAHLVFPMEGENGQRAMVSCEIKKDPVRQAVS